MSIKTGQSARRPSDRKAQILVAATRCFHQAGYDATSMEDIAAEVGITAAAMYRHFRGKQELLSRVLLDALDTFAAAVDQAEDLEQLLRAMAGFSLEHRSLPLLLERETRSLPPEDQRAVLARQAAHAAAVAVAVRKQRPDLDELGSLIVAEVVLAILSSPSYHRSAMPRPHFDEVLCAQASAFCASTVPPSPEQLSAARRPPVVGMMPANRREALLAAAIPLFKQRGFQKVNMEEVGASAGMTGTSVYHYFAGKTEILEAALQREAEVLHFALVRALSESATAQEALRRVLGAYATLWGMRTSATQLLVSEVAQLPEKRQERLEQAREGFAAECAVLLRSSRPELSEPEAQMMVRGALTVVHILSRLPPALCPRIPAEALADLAMDSLAGPLREP